MRPSSESSQAAAFTAVEMSVSEPANAKIMHGRGLGLLQTGGVTTEDVWEENRIKSCTGETGPACPKKKAFQPVLWFAIPGGFPAHERLIPHSVVWLESLADA